MTFLGHFSRKAPDFRVKNTIWACFWGGPPGTFVLKMALWPFSKQKSLGGLGRLGRPTPKIGVKTSHSRADLLRDSSGRFSGPIGPYLWGHLTPPKRPIWVVFGVEKGCFGLWVFWGPSGQASPVYLGILAGFGWAWGGGVCCGYIYFFNL